MTELAPPPTPVAEPRTRQAAIEAGWRFADRHPDEVLVLQHAGSEGCRWQLRSHSVEHGVAIAAYKLCRAHVVCGAVAVWNSGRLSRYETANDSARSISFKAR